MDDLLGGAETAFLDGDLDLARIAYEPLLKAFERHAEGFCGPEEPERMLSTDVGEAKARYLRAVYETTPLSERADTLFEEMGALRYIGGPPSLRPVALPAVTRCEAAAVAAPPPGAPKGRRPRGGALTRDRGRPRGAGNRSSGGSKEAPQRFADDLGGRRGIGSRTVDQLPSQLGIEPHRLDARRRGAQRGTTSLRPPRDQLIDVVTRLGLGGEGLDVPVGDRPAGSGVAVDVRLAHGSSSLRNLARMGMAWIAIWLPSAVVQDDHLEEVARAIRTDDKPTVGIFDDQSMIDGVEDVLVGDAVLSRRVVDLRAIQCTTKRAAGCNAGVPAK
jgi:hypothetical protein